MSNWIVLFLEVFQLKQILNEWNKRRSSSFSTQLSYEFGETPPHDPLSIGRGDNYPSNSSIRPYNIIVFCRGPSYSRTSNISRQTSTLFAFNSANSLCGVHLATKNLRSISSKNAKLWSLKWTSTSQCPHMKFESFYSDNRKLQLNVCRWRVFRVGRRLPPMLSRSESERPTYSLSADREYPCHIRGWVSLGSPRWIFGGASKTESRIAAEGPWHTSNIYVQ
jgi:hypothetical protein